MSASHHLVHHTSTVGTIAVCVLIAIILVALVNIFGGGKKQ